MTLRSVLIAASSAALLVVSLAGCSAIGDTVGKVVDVDGDTSAFDVSVGDCINDAEATAAEEVANVTIVECTEPHDYEAYHSFDLTDAETFPGDEAVTTAAQDGCVAEFEPFIGKSFEESTLDLTFIGPTEGSWTEGDREILCVVMGAELTTGSLAGSAI